MDSDAGKCLLQALARGKVMDLEQWPNLLSQMITQLEKNLLQEFPHTLTTKPTISISRADLLRADKKESHNNHVLKKEIATNYPNIDSLPPILYALYSSITDTLYTYFSKAPPHTIQRLAELLLFPRAHYRALSSYLHAIDRVVHVTSPITTFPLPPIVSDPYVGSTISSVSSIGTSGFQPEPRSHPIAKKLDFYGVCSDEALGGALLTPITWLRKSGSNSPLETEVITQRSIEIIEGPNGPGGVETVSVLINGVLATPRSNSITEEISLLSSAEDGIIKGEPLAQKEVEAITIPVPNSLDTDDKSEEDQVPHVRGPKEIDVKDIGPQWEETIKDAVERPDIQTDVKADVKNKISCEDQEKEANMTIGISIKNDSEDYPVLKNKRGAPDVDELAPSQAKRSKDSKKAQPNVNLLPSSNDENFNSHALKCTITKVKSEPFSED